MSKLIDLVVLGAGNPDIIRLIEDINNHKKIYNFIGFLDKNENLIGKDILGIPVLGQDELLLTEYKNCSVVNNIFATADLHEKVICIVKEKYNIHSFPNLIHPNVNTRYVQFGEGNLVYENVSLGVNVSIGNFNIIFYGSVVGHETTMNNYNLLASMVSVGARNKIGSKIIMANGSKINGNLSICDNVFIGMGSVVVASINREKKVFGNPAKELRF